MILGGFSENPHILSEIASLAFPAVKSNRPYQEKHYSKERIYFKIRFETRQNSTISLADFQERYHCITWARIDDREELANKLQLATTTANKLSTAELILKSFLKWGKNCVHHFTGDWVFAIWDTHKKELFIARDRFGTAGLYYYKGTDFFIFSSDIRPILACQSVPKALNPNRILQAGRAVKQDAQTCYQNINFLSYAHHLTVSKTQNQLQNYWLPTDVPRIFYQKDADYVAHFLELSQAAVSNRLGQGKTAITLSSGLDSSSIATLAAPYLEEKMESFTWQPKQIDKALAKGSIPNEVPLARMLSDHLGKFNFNTVTEKQGNILAIKRDCLEIFQQPIHINIHFYEILEAAFQKKIEVLLTGSHGNYTISHFGDMSQHFRQLVLGIHQSSKQQELLEWKRVNNWTWKRLLSQSIYQAFLVHQHKAFKKKYKPSPIQQKKSVLNHATVAQELTNYQSTTPHLTELKKELQYPKRNLISIFQANREGRSKALFEHFGITLSQPLGDIRLMEFCMGLPNEQYIGHGHRKWILKRAMQGKMPDEILFNKKRGRQQTGLLTKYRMEAKEINAVLQDFKRSPLVSYWLDLPQLEQALNVIVASKHSTIKHPFDYITKLSIGLTLGLFLLKFEGKYGG